MRPSSLPKKQNRPSEHLSALGIKKLNQTFLATNDMVLIKIVELKVVSSVFFNVQQTKPN